MPYQTYATPIAKRSTTGIFASGEPKNEDPFTAPVLPKTAPTMFQVNPLLGGNTGSASAALQGYTTTGPTFSGAGSLLAPTSTSAANNGGGTTAAGGQTTTAPAAASKTPGFTPFDPTTDPIYQRIVQMGKQDVSQAVAGGDALRKQILIALGDPAFAAKQQFGDPNSPTYGDASTTAAAAANPYSTLAGLKNTYTNNVATLDQNANKAGYYYGSAHANELANENRSYNQSITDADNSAAGQLSNIVQQILNTQNTAQNADISALGTATQNAINTAIQNGYTFLGYGPDGTPRFGAPTDTSGGTGGGGTGGGVSTTGSTTPTGDPIAPRSSPYGISALLNMPGSALDNARRADGKGPYVSG